MNDQLSATIIPFPVRVRNLPVAPPDVMDLTSRDVVAPAAPPAATPDQPHTLASSAQRLTYALNGLSSALADQRDATQRWKSALEDLAKKMRTLGDATKSVKTQDSGSYSAEPGARKITENATRQS